MTKIIFVRHGQTLWNLEMKYQGHTDIALSELGIEQAKRVSKRLMSEEFSAVYSSDLVRAFETANIIAAPKKIKVNTDCDLREICFGDWEGLTYAEINEKWPNALNQFLSDTTKITIPNGESFETLKQRSDVAINKILEKHKKETVVVVAHGATIRAMICSALNLPLDYVWRIRQDNTAVNMVEYHKNNNIVTLLNDIHHLN